MLNYQEMKVYLRQDVDENKENWKMKIMNIVN